jgi:hypothetical protein
MLRFIVVTRQPRPSPSERLIPVQIGKRGCLFSGYGTDGDRLCHDWATQVEPVEIPGVNIGRYSVNLGHTRGSVVHRKAPVYQRNWAPKKPARPPTRYLGQRHGFDSTTTTTTFWGALLFAAKGLVCFGGSERRELDDGLCWRKLFSSIQDSRSVWTKAMAACFNLHGCFFSGLP